MFACLQTFVCLSFLMFSCLVAFLSLNFHSIFCLSTLNIGLFVVWAAFCWKLTDTCLTPQLPWCLMCGYVAVCNNLPFCCFVRSCSVWKALFPDVICHNCYMAILRAVAAPIPIVYTILSRCFLLLINWISQKSDSHTFVKVWQVLFVF